jgi:succinate dehydrogenase / fumarate reductase cytochrome b subunit
MNALLKYLRSSVGKKFIMGLSGLGLAGFVLIHMAGNMLVFKGAEAYNHYGHMMTSSPVYPVLGPGLMGLFLLHAFMGILLFAQNKAARGGAGSGYAMAASQQKDYSLATKTIMATGALLLFFIVTHLASFKYGEHYTVTYDGVEMRDLFRLMVEKFSHVGFVAFYVLSLVLLAFHLSHGFSSAFQSLGLNHPKYRPLIKCGGVAYAVIVAAGFISQPIYLLFFYKG